MPLLKYKQACKNKAGKKQEVTEEAEDVVFKNNPKPRLIYIMPLIFLA